MSIWFMVAVEVPKFNSIMFEDKGLSSKSDDGGSKSSNEDTLVQLYGGHSKNKDIESVADSDEHDVVGKRIGVHNNTCLKKWVFCDGE